jgi:hypothetical protein
VIRRLAKRGNTVVAARTWRGGRGVIEGSCANIADRAAMAAPTWRIGDHMIGRLTNRDDAVVAGGAECVRLGVVDETQVAPSCRQMTAFAKIRRLRMGWWFSLGTGAIMAGKTLPRRTLEASVDMT